MKEKIGNTDHLVFAMALLIAGVFAISFDHVTLGSILIGFGFGIVASDVMRATSVVDVSMPINVEAIKDMSDTTLLVVTLGNEHYSATTGEAEEALKAMKKLRKSIGGNFHFLLVPYGYKTDLLTLQSRLKRKSKARCGKGKEMRL